MVSTVHGGSSVEVTICEGVQNGRVVVSPDSLNHLKPASDRYFVQATDGDGYDYRPRRQFQGRRILHGPTKRHNRSCSVCHGADDNNNLKKCSHCSSVWHAGCVTNEFNDSANLCSECIEDHAESTIEKRRWANYLKTEPMLTKHIARKSKRCSRAKSSDSSTSEQSADDGVTPPAAKKRRKPSSACISPSHASGGFLSPSSHRLQMEIAFLRSKRGFRTCVSPQPGSFHHGPPKRENGPAVDELDGFVIRAAAERA